MKNVKIKLALILATAHWQTEPADGDWQTDKLKLAVTRRKLFA